MTCANQDCKADRYESRADATGVRSLAAARARQRTWPWEGRQLCWFCWRDALGLSCAYDIVALAFGFERRVAFDSGGSVLSDNERMAIRYGDE